MIQPKNPKDQVPAALPAMTTAAELLGRYAAMGDELRARGITRSENTPTGDYAERVVADALGLELAAKSVRGYDAVDPKTSTRYQIKARRVTANRSRQLSTLRGLDGDSFDILVGVLFAANYAVIRAAAIPIAVVRALATPDDRVGGRRFILRDAVWNEPGVVEVTAEVRAAAEAWIVSDVP